MSDATDIQELLDGYADGALRPAELQRLLALAEQSAELRERLAWAAVTQRLLAAAHAEPVAYERVRRALQAQGLVPAPPPVAPAPAASGAARRGAPAAPPWPPARTSPAAGLWLTIGICLALGLLAAGGFWWHGRPRPANTTATGTNAAAATAERTNRAVTSAAPVGATAATALAVFVTGPATPEAPPEELGPSPDLPLSAFADGDSPAPAGDGSQEPGFMPPLEDGAMPDAGRDQPPAGGESHRLAMTGSRELPAAPVLIVKLPPENPGRRDAAAGDLNRLLAELQTRLDVAYRLGIRALDDVDPRPEKNPIIYATGHYHFAFTPAQRAKLRKFTLAGGLLVFDPGLGSKPFYDSARRELGIIFRDVRLQQLSADHPLFRACYDLARVRYDAGVRAQGYAGDEPWFEGVTVNCRTLALVSRWGLAGGWTQPAPAASATYAAADALKLGLNLCSYALAARSGNPRAVRRAAPLDREAFADKLFLGQVVYDGEWQTKPSALPVLLQTFNRRTEVPVRLGIRELRLSNPKIFDAPLLYITGHQSFALTPAEISQLRKYLLSGGFLFAEACCGRQGFDQALRAALRAVLPEKQFASIPLNQDVFTAPNAVQRISVTPSLASQLGTTVMAPRLEGIELQGHYAVIYSPYGMAGCWDMGQAPYALGYNDIEALQLGQNILFYALTH